jgi:hypothetical protein
VEQAARALEGGGAGLETGPQLGALADGVEHLPAAATTLAVVQRGGLRCGHSALSTRDGTPRTAGHVTVTGMTHGAASYPRAMTELDTRPVGDPQLDDGDDDPKYSHYVRKEDIVRSAVDGVPVTALCGKKWLPGRDPEKYPVCPRCKEMMGMLEQMHS